MALSAAPDNVFTRMMRDAKVRKLQKAQEDREVPKDSTARDNVFGITELVEQIFLECRIADLLINCQRVCKEWRNMITASTRLQQALFFESVGGYDIDYFGDRFADWWQDDGLEEWEDEDKGKIAEAQRREAERECVLVFRNPFFEKVQQKAHMAKYFAPATYVAIANEDYNQRCRAMEDRNASWRRMLACQPPLFDCDFDRLDYPDQMPMKVEAGHLLLHDTINTDSTYAARPHVFDKMTPVVFAKDVARINYKDGDYEFEECEHDMAWDVELDVKFM